ncbi:20296_t:CDS:2, partial [Gigaspora margarita]
TSRTWLCHLGFVYKPHQQGVYYNGHEYSNIVQYHIAFLEKIKDLKTLMLQFVSNNMEIAPLKIHDCLTITPAEINELNLPLTFSQEAHIIIKSEKIIIAISNKAISIFEATYPICIGVFVFNNITNYSAFANDTLCAKNMNLYSGRNSQDYIIASLLMSK